MVDVTLPLRLSHIQKEILVVIFAAPTPQLAYEEILNVDEQLASNYSVARDVLYQLGIIDITQAGLMITDYGLDIMINYDLIDATGNNITDYGREILNNRDTVDPDPIADIFSTESFDLIRSVQNISKLYD